MNIVYVEIAREKGEWGGEMREDNETSDGRWEKKWRAYKTAQDGGECK